MKVWVVNSPYGTMDVFNSAEKAYDYILDNIYQSPYIEQEDYIAELKEEFDWNRNSFGVEDFLWTMAYEVI